MQCPVHKVQRREAKGEELGGPVCDAERLPQRLPTFARGSIASVARLADTVVSSNSVKAQSVFVAVVLVCEALIVF